ncbi:hypothetical protein NC653_035166 [Populus alba x Populus x berolinensis]|uniref:DUF4408 domain-containing protein n=1 Tax=Populus alba x Populus x berolinensis TaxID=444605 RepID=A0AAD6LPC4_9ROSI|nr:hypothetical protein NC653_035166 [Populus alba x Populus x berolinensis]
MDLIKLREIHAINKSKKHQFLDNFFLYSFTVLSCTLFCSSPFWFPSLFHSMKLFLFVSLPKLSSILLSPKFIFIVGNLIIFVLVGESKYFTSNSPLATDVYYDEYIDQKKSLQTTSASVEEKKEVKMEEAFKEEQSKTCESGENIGGKGLSEGNLKAHKEPKDLEGEEEFSLPTEELKKRADDFIARVNRQRMLEARLLLSNTGNRNCCVLVFSLRPELLKHSMDLIHKVLNIVLPPITLILLLLLLPSFIVSKFISRIKRSINSEMVAGKVVLITGASSGIGEYLAYEYARRGACLALAARRQERLRAVADKARALGSPDVIVIPTDISKVEDSERFINEAVNHFGKCKDLLLSSFNFNLCARFFHKRGCFTMTHGVYAIVDHLVNNAGVIQIDMFEDCKQISDFATLTNTNFWGSVYTTHFAIPHLRKSKGRIVGISSIAGWCSVPRMSFYCASKAAITSFYETLRAEFGSDIGITIVTPGVVESEMSQGDFLSKAQLEFVPVESTERCAKAIVDSACRGDGYLIEPSWARMSFLLKVLCPEMEVSSIAFEYARRGACLALVARRKERLIQVAAMAELIGSPEAIFIPGDVTKDEDVKDLQMQQRSTLVTVSRPSKKASKAVYSMYETLRVDT